MYLNNQSHVYAISANSKYNWFSKLRAINSVLPRELSVVISQKLQQARSKLILPRVLSHFLHVFLSTPFSGERWKVVDTLEFYVHTYENNWWRLYAALLFVTSYGVICSLSPAGIVEDRVAV